MVEVVAEVAEAQKLEQQQLEKSDEWVSFCLERLSLSEDFSL
jgi:hypothetical protein